MDNGSHPWFLLFFPSKSGPPVIFFMTRQRMLQTLLGTKRQMLCMTAATWIIQRKHLDLALFIKKCHDVQLKGFQDYFKVHSSRNIGRGKLSSRDHRSPSLHLAATSSTRVSTLKSIPEYLERIQNSVMMRRYQKVSLKLRVSRLRLCYLMRPPTAEAAQDATFPRWRNASALKFTNSHIYSEARIFEQAVWGDMMVGTRKPMPKNQNHPLEGPLQSQGTTYQSDLLCSQETTNSQTINPNSIWHSAASIFSEQ